MNRINLVSDFLKEKFGERTLKICVDGGFTCPNRDGTKGKLGCIYCSQKGSGEHIKSKDIEKQVKDILEYKKNRANKFVVYFQNFTNTYGEVEEVKKKYDASLIDEKIVGLFIATRPDVINKEIVELLKTYKEKYYVCVELGLQTINEKIGEKINRKYTNEDFINALKLLNNAKIDVVTHIMIGLPGETKKDIENITEFINENNIKGLKIHSTYIVENTILSEMYKNGQYRPITFDYYMENLIYIITHLRKDIVIHRFSGDPPKEILVAPEWENHKKKVMNTLNNKLKNENLYQGIFYNKG